MNISGFCTQWQYFPVNFLTVNFSIVSYSNALKCSSRARDYCTTAKHVINMCVNVIKVGPATYMYFFTFNISPSSMLLFNQSLCTSWQYTSLLKHPAKKTWNLNYKKLIFSPRISKQQIQWLNDHLIKNYNPWKVHVPNKALERSFLYQSYENFFCVWLLWTRNWALFSNARYLTDCHVHRCLLFFFDLKFLQSSHPLWVFFPLISDDVYLCQRKIKLT